MVNPYLTATVIRDGTLRDSPGKSRLRVAPIAVGRDEAVRLFFTLCFAPLSFAFLQVQRTCEKATRVQRSLVATPNGGLPHASGAVRRCRVGKSDCGP